MKIALATLSSLALMILPLTGLAGETQPVRLGCGLMTFDTVPGWGLRADGKSLIGPTHGGVVVDKAGNVYTSAQRGIFVFSPDGKMIHSYEGGDYTQYHDIEIRDEDGTEYIYGARNNNAEGIKFRVNDGKVV